jgi:hypothetical protein
MPSTYTLITSNVLASTATSVTFSAIPATYTDLVLRLSLRASADGGPENVQITFNGATSTYSSTYVQGTGSAAASSRYTGQAIIQFPNVINGTAYTADTFGSVEIYIPSYTASQNKPLSGIGASENNATGAFINATAALWSSTAAITSITIDQSGGNYAIGSSFYLYGIKNS